MDGPDLTQLDATPLEDIYGDDDVSQLEQAFVNERAAPDLLTFESELMARLETQVKAQEEAAAEAEASGAGGELVRVVLLSELERVKYLMRVYLRTRLLKIEQHAAAVLDDTEMHDRLSPREQQYVQDYFLEFVKALRESVLLHLPESFTSCVKQSSASEERDMMPMVDLDTHVFLRVLEDRGTVQLDASGTETAEFNKGDLYVTRYRYVKDLIKEKWVHLI